MRHAITTRPWPGSGRMHPPLWDVLIGGKPIDPARGHDTSAGRVLKMGRRDLPVLDGADFGPFGSCATRRDAALVVAERALSLGRCPICRAMTAVCPDCRRDAAERRDTAT